MAFPMKSTIMLLPKRKDHRPSSYPIYDWMPKLSSTIVVKFKLICLEPSHDVNLIPFMKDLLGKAYYTKINYPAYECRQSEGIFMMKPLGAEIMNDLFAR